MALRSIYFGSTKDLGNLPTDLILWIPYNIQFTTFSLILVFYAKLLHNAEWATRKAPVWFIFALVNCFSVGLTLGVIVYSCVADACDPNESDEHIFSRGIGAAYLLLTVVYGYYGFMLIVKQRAHKISVPNIQGPWKITAVTIMAWLIFATRGVYDIIKTFGIWELNLSDDGRKLVDVDVFCLYFFWEVLPTFIILLYFRHIPSAVVPYAGLRKCCRCCWPRGRKPSRLAAYYNAVPEFKGTPKLASGNASDTDMYGAFAPGDEETDGEQSQWEDEVMQDIVYAYSESSSKEFLKGQIQDGGVSSIRVVNHLDSSTGEANLY